jgi:hypothetical protein
LDYFAIPVNVYLSRFSDGSSKQELSLMTDESKLLNWVHPHISMNYFCVLVELNIFLLDVSTPEVKASKVNLVILCLDQADYVVTSLLPYFTVLVLIEALEFAMVIYFVGSH